MVRAENGIVILEDRLPVKNNLKLKVLKIVLYNPELILLGTYQVNLNAYVHIKTQECLWKFIQNQENMESI